MVSRQAMPRHAVPRHAVPRRAMPRHAMPCCAVSHCAECRRATPRRVTPLYAVSRRVVSRPANPRRAAPRRAKHKGRQRLHVKSEVAGDGEAAFLAASVAGGMSGGESRRRCSRVLATMAALHLHDHVFLAERVRGTGMEAAVAWRNSANASSGILTRVSMEEGASVETGREQHAE